MKINKEQLYESAIDHGQIVSALKQAAIWGTGSYLAHKSAVHNDKRQYQNLKDKKFIKATPYENPELNEIHRKSNLRKGIAATLSGAAAGAAGTLA